MDYGIRDPYSPVSMMLVMPSLDGENHKVTPFNDELDSAFVETFLTPHQLAFGAPTRGAALIQPDTLSNGITVPRVNRTSCLEASTTNIWSASAFLTSQYLSSHAERAT